MKTFELRNVSNGNIFGRRCMDWCLLGNGRFSMLTGNNRLIQQVLKVIFINKQPWGYGTSIMALKGSKDVDVANGAAAAMIDDGLKNLRVFQNEEILTHGSIPDEELITSVTKLRVDQTEEDPTKFKVNLHITDGTNTEIEFEDKR